MVTDLDYKDYVYIMRDNYIWQLNSTTLTLLDRIATTTGTETGEDFWDMKEAHNVNMSFSFFTTSYGLPSVVYILIKVNMDHISACEPMSSWGLMTRLTRNNKLD